MVDAELDGVLVYRQQPPQKLDVMHPEPDRLPHLKPP